jgi:hypothetical protein
MDCKFRNHMLLSSLSFRLLNGELSKNDISVNFALCLPYGYGEYGRDDYNFVSRKEVSDMLDTYYYNPVHLYTYLADIGMELKVDLPISVENVEILPIQTKINQVTVDSYLDYSWIVVYVKVSGVIFPIDVIRVSDEGSCVESPSSIRIDLMLEYKNKGEHIWKRP